MGHSSTTQICPPTTYENSNQIINKNLNTQSQAKKKCISNPKVIQGVGSSIGVQKEGGYTLDELKTMWTCSHAVSNYSQAADRMYPNNENFEKTKWKSILSVEPKAFFDKYLTQVFLYLFYSVLVFTILFFLFLG